MWEQPPRLFSGARVERTLPSVAFDLDLDPAAARTASDLDAAWARTDPRNTVEERRFSAA